MYRYVLPVLLVTSLVAGCTDDPSPGNGADAGNDTTEDTGTGDAATDTTPQVDTTPDVQEDTAPDVEEDTTPDVEEDVRQSLRMQLSGTVNITA